jgi:hypothetical protein
MFLKSKKGRRRKRPQPFFLGYDNARVQLSMAANGRVCPTAGDYSHSMVPGGLLVMS